MYNVILCFFLVTFVVMGCATTHINNTQPTHNITSETGSTDTIDNENIIVIGTTSYETTVGLDDLGEPISGDIYVRTYAIDDLGLSFVVESRDESFSDVVVSYDRDTYTATIERYNKIVTLQSVDTITDDDIYDPSSGERAPNRCYEFRYDVMKEIDLINSDIANVYAIGANNDHLHLGCQYAITMRDGSQYLYTDIAWGDGNILDMGINSVIDSSSIRLISEGNK